MVARQLQEFKKAQQQRTARSSGRGRRERAELKMVAVFKQPLTAAEIKAKARSLGADLVGIADGATLELYPPDPRNPQRPSDITDLDGGRVIVLATRAAAPPASPPGMIVTSIMMVRWRSASRGRLARARLLARRQRLSGDHRAADACWNHWRYDAINNRHMTTLLSLPHAAVEAGLGTLGLNLQLLTAEMRRGCCSQQFSARSMSSATARWRPRSASGQAAAAALRPARPMPSVIGRAIGRPAIASARRTASRSSASTLPASSPSRMRRGRKNWSAPRTASISGKAFYAGRESLLAAAAAPMSARSAPIMRRC